MSTNEINWLGALALLLLLTFYVAATIADKPECPQYTKPRLNAGGWYCTVLPLDERKAAP